MIVAITERVDDLVNDVDAMHGSLIVSLDPADVERGPTLGYARLLLAWPIARHEGVAVVLGEENRAGVPDPCVILVRSGRGAIGIPVQLEIRRRALPVLIRVEPISGAAVVLRRIGVGKGEPGDEEAVVAREETRTPAVAPPAEPASSPRPPPPRRS